MENKVYVKVIDGVTVRKTRTEIVVVKDNMQTINPTEEMLFDDGWVEYVAPELSEMEKIYIAKDAKIEEILAYDKSDNVNIFKVYGVPMWLDKDTRAGLMLRLQAEEMMGKTETTLWYEGTSFTLPIDVARQILFIIENYASACYDKTQEHIVNIKNLGKIAEIIDYDYTVGYPEKISIDKPKDEPEVESEPVVIE
jgi:hypothetical protein